MTTQPLICQDYLYQTVSGVRGGESFIKIFYNIVAFETFCVLGPRLLEALIDGCLHNWLAVAHFWPIYGRGIGFLSNKSQAFRGKKIFQRRPSTISRLTPTGSSTVFESHDPRSYFHYSAKNSYLQVIVEHDRSSQLWQLAAKYRVLLQLQYLT